MDVSNQVMYIPYYRVSTKKQEKSGLGLDSQKSIIKDYIDRNNGTILEEFIEIESGKNRSRPELLKAVSLSKAKKAILIVAKLDRLARDVEFAFMVSNRAHEIICCDMPKADKLMFGIQALLADYYIGLNKERTKNATNEKRKQGYVWVCKRPLSDEDRKKSIFVRKQLATTNDTYRQARELAMSNKDLTLQTIADKLNGLNYKTINGKPYRAETVRRLLK
jgi:DNA invertase Pin-like site-specific DNA recombinase